MLVSIFWIVNVEGDDTMGIQYQGDNFGVDVEKKEGSEPRLTFGFKKKLKKKPKYILATPCSKRRIRK